MSLGICTRIIKGYNKAEQLHNNFKDSHPIAYSVIVFVLGTVFGGIITHYVENTFWNTEPPYITNINPSPNSYINEIPEAIIVNFVAKTGIDEDNSKINLTGSKSGFINGTIIFTKDTMSFRPETELKPDEYLVRIQIADGTNPPQEKNYNFYIYKKPTLTITGTKLLEEFEKYWLNKKMYDLELVWNESYDYYDFNIVNDNDIAIQNLYLTISLSGVVIKEVPYYEKFAKGYKFKLGATSYSSPGRKIDSCTLRIEIDNIAPGGVFDAAIVTDSNMSNYTYVEWCFPKNDIEYANENGIYGGYQGSYDYIEYGLEKTSNSIRGNITGEKAIRK